MDEFLAIAFTYPTLFWTIAMVVVLVYWGAVIAGALDIDLLGAGADAAGASKGALDAVLAAKGGVEAGAKAGAELLGAGAKAGGELLGDAAGADSGIVAQGADLHHGEAPVASGLHAADGMSAALLAGLRLRAAPVTVSVSFLALYAWILAFIGSKYAVEAGLGDSLLLGTGVLASSFLLSWPLAGITTAPLGALFHQRGGQRLSSVIGQTVRVSTSRADAKFGEAEFEDGGAGLVLQVRCDARSLKKGEEALIVSWDRGREAFRLEPLQAPEEAESGAEGNVSPAAKKAAQRTSD